MSLGIIREHNDNVWVGETLFRFIKGETFKFGDRNFTVTVHTAKTFRLKDSFGTNYTWKIYNKVYCGESPQVRQLESAITSNIILDLLNEFNIFHDIHPLTYKLKENLEKLK